ncbi:MAG: flagellar biosynthesis anti-sigma factor FlgM [Candidatus Nealsonbacteria bacterium]|nr:flagellar biosynthesis anti-sigma factor FlgM [Candidatus Nealsonbacteria bacterium]
MHIYGPAHLHGPQQVGPPHSTRPSEPVARPDATPINDEVDISQEARLVEQTHQIPDVRQDRVDSIRSQLAAGTYETAEKLDVAVDRLLDEIG